MVWLVRARSIDHLYYKGSGHTQALGSSPLPPFCLKRLCFMDRRPRLARWQHAAGGGGAASSPGAMSSTTSTSGVRARQTDAGALPRPIPATARPWATTCSEGDATCSSSSRTGSRGSPTSSGTNPQAVNPSAAFCPLVKVAHTSSTGSGFRHTGASMHSGGAPARYGQAPPPSCVPCAQTWVEAACFLSVS